MQQYTQGTFAAPWGGNMRVGVTKLTYWDKEGENIEVKGHKPDINCSGHDAFETALNLGIDDGRVMGFREKNEKESENRIYAEYDPKAVFDSRKAYYAKYLEPAIAEIEKQNAVANRLAHVRNRLSALHNASPDKKPPYTSQPANINFSNLRILNDKRQNS